MKVGILGAGHVGGTLGRGLAKAGHTVVFGLRDPGDAKHAALRDVGSLASLREAVASSEAVILATPWRAAEGALEAAGDFEGKPLIDATNPIGPGLTLVHGHTSSGAEQVAAWAKSARVVKAFNTTGFENMGDPRYRELRAVMFVCGDDDEACAVALSLAKDLGFDAVRAGKLDRARLLEPLAVLWIQLAMGLGHGRDIAFGLLRR